MSNINNVFISTRVEKTEIHNQFSVVTNRRIPIKCENGELMVTKGEKKVEFVGSLSDCKNYVELMEKGAI